MRFAAIATSWCTREMQFFLNQHANVVVFPATPNVELVYAISKAILAPSLWPEAFGLVALEASLRGIPAITSDSAGLREANPVPAHVVRTPLVFDVNAQQLLRRASQDGALLGKPGGHNDAELDKGTTPGFSSMIAWKSNLQPDFNVSVATVSTQDLRLCFENSTRAIDSSKNQPNRLRCDRARDF